MKLKDTSLFMLSLLMQRVEELVDQGVEILEELIAQHRHQGGIVLVATHVPINLPDALALRLPPR
jgi:ABC-type transport system involved in cytochrome c biogenesis ATPase subunit